MPGYSSSIPVGMIFKSFYCRECGQKLKKEKNHRIVTKHDIDYYHYHERGTFPKYDHSVYNYHFKCKNCNNRYSYKYQCIINKIQKYKNRKIISKTEIKENFESVKKQYRKECFIRDLLVGYIFTILCLLLVYIFSKDIRIVKIMGALLLGFITFIEVRSYLHPERRIKSNSIKRRVTNYSPNELFLLEYLFTLSFNNKNILEESEECYCYYCNKKFNTNEVKNYEEEVHALCPYCNNKTLLSKNDDCNINDYTVELMNKYWY